MKYLNTLLTKEELDAAIATYRGLRYSHSRSRYNFEIQVNDILNKLLGDHVYAVKEMFETNWDNFGYVREGLWNDESKAYTRMSGMNMGWLKWKSAVVNVAISIYEDTKNG